MNNVLIKVCGICDDSLLPEIAIAGVNYVGIVFHPPSRRYVQIDQAIKISQTAIKAKLIPVGIFVNHSAAEMQSICELTHIRVLQLHGQKAKLQHHLLPKKYQRIYVKDVANNGEIHIEKGMTYLDNKRDWILYDHPEAGKGRSFDWVNFKNNFKFRWFIAGGLSSANVGDALKLHPDGVDISSSLENQAGEKDIYRIKKLVKAVRGASCK